MPRPLIKIARQLGALGFTVLLGGLLSAALVRMSPGFGVDERLLDARLDAQSQAQVRAEHESNGNVLNFYVRHVGSTLRGDFGVSTSLQRPIGQLIRARLPVTLEMMAIGVTGGWALAFAMALAVVLCRRARLAQAAATAVSTCLLCLPSAAIAVLVFVWGGPVRAVIALILFPRLFDYFKNLLEDVYERPHILTARAKGLGQGRILLRHVLPVCAPQLLALAGISVSMAFGAAIPVETLCDLPGIGQLAWKAAIARDLPLLVSLTMLVAMATQVCNAVSDWATA
jgi:peptide/nickel transport system permease protein